MGIFGESAFKKARRGFAGALDDGAKAHQFQVQRGDLFASVKEMGSQMWNKTFGRVLPKWNPTSDPTKVINRLADSPEGFASASAQKNAVKGAGRANLATRALSKPFRVAAKHPLLALGAAALFGAKYMSDRHNREQRLETLNNYAAQNQMPQLQPADGYYGSVTPEEYAMMESQMRQSGMQGGFAEREMARRAEQEALTAQQQGPAA